MQTFTTGETTLKAARPSPGRGINPSGRMMRAMERDAEARIARALNKMRLDLLRGLNDSNVYLLPQKLGSREVLQPFADTYTAVIQDLALAGADFGREQVERAIYGVTKQHGGIEINWDLANEAAEDWARRKAGQDIVGIGQVTQRRVQKEVAAWTANDETINQLAQRLSKPNGPFSPKRAHTIAVTETTGAFAGGNQTAWLESGVATGNRWNTNVDELVCPICGPLHNEIAPIREPFPSGNGLWRPPAHPNCRCWLTPTVEGVEDLETGLEQYGLGEEITKPQPPPLPALERDRFRRFEILGRDDVGEWSRDEIEQSMRQATDWERDASYAAWHAGLSEDEKQWLALYKQDGYEWINPALRGKDRGLENLLADYGEDYGSYQKAVKKIDAAVNRHRLTDEITLWRGGSHPEIEAALKSGRKIDDLAGMVIGDDAYVSTSINSSFC